MVGGALASKSLGLISALSVDPFLSAETLPSALWSFPQLGLPQEVVAAASGFLEVDLGEIGSGSGWPWKIGGWANPLNIGWTGMPYGEDKKAS